MEDRPNKHNRNRLTNAKTTLPAQLIKSKHQQQALKYTPNKTTMGFANKTEEYDDSKYSAIEKRLTLNYGGDYKDENDNETSHLSYFIGSIPNLTEEPYHQPGGPDSYSKKSAYNDGVHVHVKLKQSMFDHVNRQISDVTSNKTVPMNITGYANMKDFI